MSHRLPSLLLITTLLGAAAAVERGSRRPPAPLGQDDPDQPPPEGHQGPGCYCLEQAVSDRAQWNTIAFNGLAFLTGDPGASSFIPPGKVADFFGFQYLRDIDAAGKGHNPMFLDRIAGNVMRLLSDDQRRAFQAEAAREAVMLEALARKRLPLVAAYHRELAGDLPAGTAGLDPAAVKAFHADLFELDARLAWSRARVFGGVARSFSDAQRRTLAQWKFGDFRSWPEVDPDTFRDLRPRGASKLESVAYMTLASEFFSWVAGSAEGDTYFCPERHGTYFGGFYLKDMPAMGRRDFDISTALTGDAGEAFLRTLAPAQRDRLGAVLDQQRPVLAGIVQVRRAVAGKLRTFLEGDGPSEAELRSLGRRYGELDGELAYDYALAFRDIRRGLDDAGMTRLRALRGAPSQESGTAFLFSDRIPMPRFPDADFLFSPSGH
jgi:hypothetical protein